MMKMFNPFVFLVFTILWTSSSGADIIWPSDGDWHPLRLGMDYYYDAEGDTNPSQVDLIGTTDSYSAGYWAYVTNGYDNGLSLEDAFMFRLRVGGGGKFDAVQFPG